MSPAQSQSGRGPAEQEQRAPVVVTFDEHNDLQDIVGNIDWFVGDGDTRDGLLLRLLDLCEGSDGGSDVIPAVELSPGRYADIHVVTEVDGMHFVLLDVTPVMQVLQRNQQVRNEMLLAQEEQFRKLLDGNSRRHEKSRLARNSLEQFRRSSELFAVLVSETRAPITLLAGHARLLARHCRADAVAMRSIAAIQHAAVCLDALSSNGLVGLGGLSAGSNQAGVLDLAQLAGTLQEMFSLQAQSQNLGFEVRLPKNGGMVEVDDLALRQILVNLIIHALEGIDGGRIVVSLTVVPDHLEVEIAAEPGGFTQAHFGPLITMADTNGFSLGGGLYLAASRQMLQRLEAMVELVPRSVGGHELWIRIPAGTVSAKPGRSLIRERVIPPALRAGESLVVVAVEAVELAATMVELLADMGVPAVAVQEGDRIEALARDGLLGALVLSDPFDGESARAWLHRSSAKTDMRVLVLSRAGETKTKMDWLQDGNRVIVAMDSDRETLQAALRAAVAG